MKNIPLVLVIFCLILTSCAAEQSNTPQPTATRMVESAINPVPSATSTETATPCKLENIKYSSFFIDPDTGQVDSSRASGRAENVLSGNTIDQSNVVDLNRAGINIRFTTNGYCGEQNGLLPFTIRNDSTGSSFAGVAGLDSNTNQYDTTLPLNGQLSSLELIFAGVPLIKILLPTAFNFQPIELKPYTSLMTGEGMARFAFRSDRPMTQNEHLFVYSQELDKTYPCQVGENPKTLLCPNIPGQVGDTYNMLLIYGSDGAGSLTDGIWDQPLGSFQMTITNAQPVSTPPPSGSGELPGGGIVPTEVTVDPPPTCPPSGCTD